MKAILALDQGTSASKAAVYDVSGRLLGSSREAIGTRFAAGGLAEQDPEEIFASQLRAVAGAIEAAGKRSLDLVAAGVASQRSTFVMWDRATGRAVGPAPTWQSTISQRACERLSRHADMVRRRTGLPLSPHYSATKISGQLDSIPGLRRRAVRGEVLFGNVATFLTWRLTGGRVHATDPTQAARTLLLNLGTLQWDERLLDLFGVPRPLLPEVRDSIGDYGSIHVADREVPLRAMLGDQQAALMGAAGSQAGNASGAALVNYGTGAFVLIPTGRAAIRRPGLLTSVAWTRGRSRCYLLEGTVNAAGATIDWLRREMGAPLALDDLDRLCRSARGESLMLPAFWGLGSVHAGPGTRRLPSLALDIPAESTVADLARAGVESIAHLVAEILDRASARGGPAPRRLVASGSLARLSYLVEFQSALLQRPVILDEAAEGSNGMESTLAGIARAATPGLWRSEGRRRRRIMAPPALRRLARARHLRWRKALSLAERWAAGEKA